MYACDIGAVREVVPIEHLTRLPGAPATVLGLANVRGSIVTVVDGAAILDGTVAHRERASSSIMALLVDVGPRGVALAVERVADVRVLGPEDDYGELDVRALVLGVVAISEER